MEKNLSKLKQDSAVPTLAAALQTQPDAGSALFVINLCASIAPIPVGKTLPGLENYRLYQVARTEDGRPRHRLRLGFFRSEADAEAVLETVRRQYPTAFAACLSDEDRRFTRGYAPSQAGNKPASSVAPITAAAKTITNAAPARTVIDTKVMEVTWHPPKFDTPTARPAQNAEQSKPSSAPSGKSGMSAKTAGKATAANPPPPTTTNAVTPTAPSSSAARTPVPSMPLTLAVETSVGVPPAKSTGTTATPFHVARGVEIPTLSLSLAVEKPRTGTSENGKRDVARMAPDNKGKVAIPLPSKDKSPAVTKKPAVPVAAKSAVAVQREEVKPRASSPAPITKSMPIPAPRVVNLDTELPDLDSTQTLRALSFAELSDETQPKWFAVQLAVSEQPVNLDAMPHLDIFAAYRLYSVAMTENRKIQHSLRIGFFREDVSAQAVCGYLKTFFNSPTVIRVSAAEQTRFAEPPAKKTPPPAEPKVIEMSSARDKAIPTVTNEVPASSMALHTSTAAKSAAKVARPAPKSKDSSKKGSGKHRSLEEALLEEAREVELSESAIRRLPKNDGLLSRVFSKLTK